MQIRTSWQQILFNLLAVFLIAIISLYNIRNLDMITILNDEFGYWANAAILAGNDWKSLLAETPYYSFGYSLLLVPFFWLFHDYAIIYKAAIVLNVLLLILSYFCAKYIASNLLNIRSEVTKFGLSVISVINGGVIFQSQVGWSETLLTLLMWASVALLVSVEKNKSNFKILALIMLFLYMLIVHQRTIVVVAIGFGCVGLISFQNKWDKKYVILFLSTFIIGYWGIHYLNGIHVAQFYGNSSASSLNNIDINSGFFLSSLQRLLSNLESFFSSFAGKIAVSLFITYFTFPIVAYQYVYDGLKCLRMRTEIKFFWIYTYILCSYLCMLLATSLQTIGYYSRKDIIVYTRYFDYTIGPIIMLGVFNLLSLGKIYKRLYVVIYLTGKILSYYTFDVIKNANNDFNVPCSPLFGGIMQCSKKMIESVNWNWEYCRVIVMQIGLIIFFGVVLANCIKKQEFKYILLVCFLLIGQVYIAYYANEWLNVARDDFRDYVKPLYEKIREDEDCIYYIKEPGRDDYYVHPKYLQFLLNNRSIDVITWEDEAVIGNNSWILLEKGSDVNDIPYVLIEATETLNLYKKECE